MWRVHDQKIFLPSTVAVGARETVVIPIVGFPPITGRYLAVLLSAFHFQRGQFVALLACIENRHFRLRQNVLHITVVSVDALTIGTLIILSCVEYVFVLAPHVFELA